MCLGAKSTCVLSPRVTESHHVTVTQTRPHLRLHIVPGLLPAAGGIDGVVANDVHHRVPHLLLQLQRECEGQGWT